MAVIYDFKTGKRIQTITKAIRDVGSHVILKIPSCYRYQTIDQTDTMLKHLEPEEPSMSERLRKIETITKPVIIEEYVVGTLYDS